jgi:HAD superfamily hydrolase (TIGR01509 family)
MVEQMNKTEAIIFDMDGVLIDSEELHAYSKRAAFRQAGITLTDSDLRDYVGRSDAVMIEEVGTRFQLNTDQRAAIFREKARIYEQEQKSLKIVPGSIEFVQWAAQHYKLALGTSATKRNRVAALDLLGIADSFQVIVDLSDVSEPKPSPEIYLTAVSRLGLVPSQCLVVEDALTGVLSAKRAGCVVSALTWSFASEALLEVGADFTFESFAKLQRFLSNDLRNQAEHDL